METFTRADEVRELVRSRRCKGQRVALVPTMGALHEGHFSLIRRAEQIADETLVSIFVNPTQFAPDEDLEEYPRDLETDKKKLKDRGVSYLFAPPLSEMYPDGIENQRTWLQMDALTDTLCGRYRPGHFKGVMTVVSKLFNICIPDVAVFGRKDAQQLVVIQKMIRDLRWDIDIEEVPIQREESGLACSSRNKYLSESERAQADALYQAVSTAKRLIEEGEQAVEGIVEAMQKQLDEAPNAKVQYAEVVDRQSLRPVETLNGGQEVIAAVAVYFGETRLIDNAFAKVPL